MLIDIGANLTHDSFEDDFVDMLARARDVDVIQMVVTGASRIGSQQAAAIAKQHEHLHATAGIHPHNAEETTADTLTELEELTREEKVV
ncbi:MAG: TatD family hydrolase, partial [Pseudomonadales bacterium]|nr:TatD family hydrolase [Pseudomonadales bacterium]